MGSSYFVIDEWHDFMLEIIMTRGYANVFATQL